MMCLMAACKKPSTAPRVGPPAAGRPIKGEDQALFGIVQGGTIRELRERSATGLLPLDFPGYAVGGLSVGETPEVMYDTLDWTVPLLPTDRPRYLMGVGTPMDLIEAVLRGIDLFDCVMPTRNGRNATAFTISGRVRLRNLKYQRDPAPLDEACGCPVCRQFSRGYLRHLFIAGEMLGPILLSIHNLAHYQQLLRELREGDPAGKGGGVSLGVPCPPVGKSARSALVPKNREYPPRLSAGPSNSDLRGRFGISESLDYPLSPFALQKCALSRSERRQCIF